ncbi:MAG: DUF1800 family protein [Flavobacteriales bacterium]|nr:DUF1800 family protein [Flavobacteriales bacterium]
MPLQPYAGPFGAPELRHLLRRTLFGASNADLAHFAGMSLTDVVDELLTFTNNTTPPIKAYSIPDGSNQPDPTLVDPDVPFGSTWTTVVRDPGLVPNPNIQRVTSFQQWWTGLLVGQDRNVREKMVLFWHTNLATQASTVQLAEPLYVMNQLLRDQCLGNFRSMMFDVTVDASMLIYLNGYVNTNLAPDENYGRELMELFTLGEGTGYTEEDVHTAARVLTGWTVQIQNGGAPILPAVGYFPFLHDATDKQFSAFFNNTVIQGQTGAGGGTTEINALLDMIFAKEEAGLRMARKLYHFFVHGEISAEVETDVIQPLAQIFRDNASAPDQMRIVLQALLTSDHFFSADVRACMITSPTDFIIGTLRELELPMPTTAQFEAQYYIWNSIFSLLYATGQAVSEPPNVAGWVAYYQAPVYDGIWMDTASYVYRLYTYQVITYLGLSTPNNLYQPQSRNLQLTIDLIALTQQFTTPEDPNALVAQAAELLFRVDVSQQVKDQLKTNYLLFGQQSDHYWTDAYLIDVADPNTQNTTAQLVPILLMGLFLDMQGAAEHQLV